MYSYFCDRTLVKNENRIFYSVGWYKKPVISGLEQYLNFQFRSEIGLETTLDIANTVNSLPQLSEESNNFSFEDKTLPFTFAQGRHMFAPSLDLSKAGETMSLRDTQLREEVKRKFLSKVLAENESIRKQFEERNKESEASGKS